MASESVSGPTKINSDTISVTAAAETAGGDTIASVNIYNGTALVGAATRASGTSANGVWTYTASGLADGTYNFSAVAEDAAGNATTAALAPVTMDAATPKVVIAGAGGAVTSPSQTIAGTVTEPTEANVVGTTVSLYDNGALTAFATATVQADGSWSAPVTLSSGVNRVVAQDVDLAGNAGSSTAVVYTNGTVATPTITSEIYSGGHWILGGTATAGATVTVYDGAKSLGTATASTTGTWTFTTAENNSAIRVYTAIATSGSLTSVASAPVYEGTTGANTFAFASEAAVAAAALINGNGGTDTLQLTAPGVLIDTDFAHVITIQTLALTGASGVTL